jgi:hypothetical protein
MSWHGGPGLLAPALDTTSSKRSTVEFVIEDTGHSAGCLISFGVTALDKPYVLLRSYLFFSRCALVLCIASCKIYLFRLNVFMQQANNLHHLSSLSSPI